MRIGLIGLGKMGGNMRERLRNAGHDVIGYDTNPELSDADSLADLVDRLEGPRAVWVMVPAGGPTQAVIDQLATLLKPRDIVV
ncbi:NAD(P)-binding domain-containing protein, partial [Streptomyces fumanus]